MVGTVYNKSKWLIDFEFYNKKTNQITNKTDDGQGSIASFGADIFLKKKWKKLENWISCSISKTNTDFNETDTDAFFDQRHVFTFTNQLNLNNWKFALSWGYSSGLPVIYADETDFNTLELIESDNFPGLHQLDFSSTYTLYNSSKRFKTVIGLSLLNVYNQDNIVNAFQNTTATDFRKASGFSPNLQINLFF